ncbi:MAG: hypothetical protein KF709_03065 [Gemmatimonadaceae bacterium]|nr:hypothetical protein [Gemmatimonadaceae bacterium]
MRNVLPFLIALVAVVGCDRNRSEQAASDVPHQEVHVDSALPIDTLLARFRATVADTPRRLDGGARDAEALTRALLTALQEQDTAALRQLVLTRSEFAWLYYPHTKFTAPPYELGPELLWFQLQLASEKGATRLVRRYGGSSLRFEALECPDSVSVEGPNRVVTGCRVRFAAADSAARTMRLFGSLLERDGRVKFVTYANDL